MGSVREKSSFDEVKGRYVVNIEGGETALTAQAPSWNYVCTPLRLRRRKQIYPKKPTSDFGIRKRRLSAQPA